MAVDLYIIKNQMRVVLSHGCSVRKERECAESKALLCKRDTDKSNAKHDTYKKVNKREPPTEERYPKKIAYRVAVKVCYSTMTEGPYSVTSNFYKLKAGRNKDYCRAKRNADHKVNSRHPKSVNQKPYNISNKLHHIFS